jgi:signal transduction histidine kinase
MSEAAQELPVELSSDDRRPDGVSVWPVGTTDNGASETVAPALVRRFQIAAEVLGWIALVLGLVVLVVGWWLDVDIVARVIPGSVTMKANTAVGLGAGGLAIVTYRRDWHLGVMVAMAALVAIIGWVTSVEYLADIRWSGFDELLAREAPGAVATSNPGRMGANTAINYALLGPALFMLAVRRGVGTRQILAVIVTTIGFVAVLGYALGLAELSGLLAGATQMAVNTSVLHVALGLGILFCHPDLGLMRPVVSKRAGGGVIRMYVPVALGATLLIGLLAEHVLAPLTGSPTFALQLAIASLILGAFVIVFVIGRRLDRIDTEREALVRDIADRKAAQKASEETIRAKNQFLASVSHELRTPLTGILGFAELLRDNEAATTAHERAAMIASVATEASDLTNIIEDLLVASRAELGQLTVSRVPVAPRAQIAQVLEASFQDVSSRIEVIDHLHEYDRAIADPGRVRQILRNLLSNACRYGGDHIQIRVDTADGAVRVRVADDGPSPLPDEWERIFEPYHRLHTRQGQPESIGIGLAIARELAHLMDGDLTYQRSKGWSIFELTIPAAPTVQGDGSPRRLRASVD